jgi:large subunit ribosomal protein L4
MTEKKVVGLSVDVLSLTGEKVGTFDLSKEVFGIEPHEQSMFDAVQVYQSNKRQATAKTKKRGEVSGGGKKPWRQKGTGRARQGSTRSPNWVGGGKVFGPTGIQNFKRSQNKAAHHLALCSALSQKALAEKIVVVDMFKFESMKTTNAVKAMEALKLEGKILIIVDSIDLNTFASTRNLSNLLVVDPTNVSVYDLLNSDVAVFTKEAVTALQEALQ